MKLWPSPQPLPMKFHELRHSTNTLLVKAGVSDRIIQKIIGHLSKKMTDRYTHLDLEDMREALTKLAGKGLTATPEAPITALSSAAPASSTAGKLTPIYCHSTAAAMSANEKAPAPEDNSKDIGAIIGAEHRVRTGDLRLGNLAEQDLQGAANACKGLESQALGHLLNMPPMQPDAAICKEVTAGALLNSDALLTVEDAANRLAVSKAMAYRLCRAGLLRAVRVGRCVRVDACDLEEFIDQMRRRAAPG